MRRGGQYTHTGQPEGWPLLKKERTNQVVADDRPVIDGFRLGLDPATDHDRKTRKTAAHEQ